jgi:hypothetical protein
VVGGEGLEGAGELCFGLSVVCWIGRGMGDILFNALSASRTRKSRACWRVLRDSLMRETASLSGVMLKLPIVWWMSLILLDAVEFGKTRTYRCGIFVEEHFERFVR